MGPAASEKASPYGVQCITFDAQWQIERVRREWPGGLVLLDVLFTEIVQHTVSHFSRCGHAEFRDSRRVKGRT